MVTGETETFGQRTEDNIGQYTATLSALLYTEKTRKDPRRPEKTRKDPKRPEKTPEKTQKDPKRHFYC